MRAFIKSILFLTITIILLLYEAVISLLMLPFGNRNRLRVLVPQVPFWARLYAFVLGVEIRLRGRENIPEKGPYCIIGNHLSYLDILFVGYHFPLVFVGRHDVKYWPLVGGVAWMLGTVFVDRSIRGKADRPYIRQIVKRFQQGFNVVIFPEGTSTDGRDVLPFKKTIFTCPIRAGVPILPITIRYLTIDGEPFGDANRDRVCWYGDMGFVDHFWRFLKLKRMVVEIVAHPIFTEPLAEDWIQQTRDVSARIYQIVRENYISA